MGLALFPEVQPASKEKVTFYKSVFWVTVHTRQDHWKATNELITHMINKAQQGQKQAYNRWKNDTPQLQPGDHVWLKTMHLLTDCPSPKLDWKWIGPLPITERLGPLMYCLHLLASYRIHNVFHVSLLTPVKEDHILGWTVPPPDPITIVQEGDEIAPNVKKQYYIMEQYMDSQWIINKMGEWEFQFKVKWDGYDILTWESCTRLNDGTARTNQLWHRYAWLIFVLFWCWNIESTVTYCLGSLVVRVPF